MADRMHPTDPEVRSSGYAGMQTEAEAAQLRAGASRTPYLATFDLETTGVDVESDRIVSAALIILDRAGTPITTNRWLVNPGVPIPEEATAVHGITTEHVVGLGIRAAEAVEQIALLLYRVNVVDALPLVIYNAPYDLTLLDREIRRHEVGIVGDIGGVSGLWWDPRPVIDPLVIDKHFDPYRKGSRRLVDTARMFGVPLGDDDAHGSEADALAAGRIAIRMLDTEVIQSRLQAGSSIDDLHEAQIRWKAEQSSSFADYLRRKGDPEWERIDGSWPWRPLDDGNADA